MSESTSDTGSGVSLGGLELVDLGRLELSGGHSVLEEDVELSVRSSLGLGESEVGPDETEHTGTEPEVSRLGTPVPGGRVEHVRVEDADDDTTQVVEVSGEDDRLGSQSGGTDLTDERVADRTDGDVVDESEDDEESADSPSGRVGGLDRAEDTGEDHDETENDLAVDVDVPSTEGLHEEPRGDGSDTTDDEHDQVQGRSGLGGHAGGFEEVGGHTHERGTRDGLDEPDETSDLGSSKVDTLETVKEGGSDLGLLLELVGVVHHRDLLLGVVDTGVVGQSKNRSFGVLESAFSGQPPRPEGLVLDLYGLFFGEGHLRLGGHEDTDEDGDGPDPLDGEGDLVGPFSGVADQSSVDTRADDLSDDPAEVDVGGQERSDLDGHDLGGVRHGHGLEGTPRETEQEVGDEEHGQIDGEELEEEETGESDYGDKHGGSVAESLRGPTGDLKTQDLSDLDRAGETGLPSGGDLPFVLRGIEDAELCGERLVGIELTEQEGVVTFHDDGSGEF